MNAKMNDPPYGKIAIAIVILLFLTLQVRNFRNLDWSDHSDQERFQSDQDFAQERFQSDFQSDQDFTLLPAGEKSSSYVNAYSPGGVSYETTVVDREKWYEDSILEWVRRQECFEIGKCDTCGKNFSDCGLEYKKEDTVRSVLVGGPLVDVTHGRDEIQFTLNVLCECPTEFKISGYRNRVVSKVEAPSSGTRSTFIMKSKPSYGRHKSARNRR